MDKKNILSVEFIYCGCNCGKTLPKYDYRHRLRKFIYGHQRWNKGYRVKQDGYYYIRINGKYVRENRYVYEQYHKVCVLRYVAVHHINGNKLDNRIENLETKYNWDHGKYHRVIQLINKPEVNRTCLICGTNESKDGKWNHWYKKDNGYWCYRCAARIRMRDKKLKDLHQ